MASASKRTAAPRSEAYSGEAIDHSSGEAIDHSGDEAIGASAPLSLAIDSSTWQMAGSATDAASSMASAQLLCTPQVHASAAHSMSAEIAPPGATRLPEAVAMAADDSTPAPLLPQAPPAAVAPPVIAAASDAVDAHPHGEAVPTLAPTSATATAAAAPTPDDEAELCEAMRGMQEQLRKVLAANHSRVTDLFRLWDRGGDGKVRKAELGRALASLGYDASAAQVDALFDSFDADGSGSIDYHELHRTLRACQAAVAAASMPTPTTNPLHRVEIPPPSRSQLHRIDESGTPVVAHGSARSSLPPRPHVHDGYSGALHGIKVRTHVNLSSHVHAPMPPEPCGRPMAAPSYRCLMYISCKHHVYTTSRNPRPAHG